MGTYYLLAIWILLNCIQRSRAASLRVKRVIGGVEVELGEWPWLAHLTGKIPTRTFWGIPFEYKVYYCGASVINSQWLLTAAHCFQQHNAPDGIGDPERWHARVGEIVRTPSTVEKLKHLVGRVFNNDAWLHSYHAKTIVLHPGYDRTEKWQNDIALVKLDTTLDLEDPHTQPVDMPVQGNVSFPEDGQTCIMKGWGCVRNGGGASDSARMVELPKVSDLQCRQMYDVDTDTRLCAGQNFAFTGICRGDSGGPLVCHDNTRWIQVGVASFTSSVRPGHVPGGFTRVSMYIDWIKKTIQEHEDT